MGKVENNWQSPNKALPEPHRDGKTVSDTVVILLCGDEPVIGFYSTNSGWFSGGVSIHSDDVAGWFPLPITTKERAWRGEK